MLKQCFVSVSTRTRFDFTVYSYCVSDDENAALAAPLGRVVDCVVSSCVLILSARGTAYCDSQAAGFASVLT
jgi:hypothetical protein